MLNIHWKDWCWSSNTLVTLCEKPTHWKRPSCWERLKAEGEEGHRGWDGWMTSLIQWTWTWANSGRWWRTGKPGVPQSAGLQRVRNNFGHCATTTKKWKLSIELHWPIKALWRQFPLIASVQCSSVQSLSHVWLFVIPWTAARQASLSITNSRSLLTLMSTESVMPSNELILCHPLLLLPSIFPRIRVFSNESALCIRWPNYQDRL